MKDKIMEISKKVYVVFVTVLNYFFNICMIAFAMCSLFENYSRYYQSWETIGNVIVAMILVCFVDKIAYPHLRDLVK